MFQIEQFLSAEDFLRKYLKLLHSCAADYIITTKTKKILLAWLERLLYEVSSSLSGFVRPLWLSSRGECDVYTISMKLLCIQLI
jgi:hypothetical protein